ncbi:MAG TPA: hypothetical protein DE045_07785 [Oceanospirillaceae bacterium]|nr:hypothetical protein [Oceanospirillaceae bacterium]
MLEILKSVDLKSWIGLAGVLLGALLGLIGVFLANRSNLSRLQLQLENERQRHHFQVKREKLEELYVLLSHWVNMFFSHYFKLTLVMKGEIDYNQYLDEIIADGADKKTDFKRIEMILHIYARELLPTYNEVLEWRGKVNDVSAAHKADYKQGKCNGEEYIKPYIAVHTQLENKVEKLKSELAELAANA